MRNENELGFRNPPSLTLLCVSFFCLLFRPVVFFFGLKVLVRVFVLCILGRFSGCLDNFLYPFCLGQFFLAVLFLLLAVFLPLMLSNFKKVLLFNCM